MNRLKLSLIFLFAALALPVRAAHPHFALPADSFTDPRPLAALKLALEQKDFPAAAILLDALLDEEGDKLKATEEGGLISIAAWVETLPPSQKGPLATAYREKFDAGVREKVDVLRRDADTHAETFYSLARRHRFSTTGAAAYALAADRSLVSGDLPAAHSLYQLAMRGGWIPDDTRAAQIELLRRLDEGHSLATFPTELSGPPSSPLTRPAATFTGPLPFDAPWFDNLAIVGQPRFFMWAGADLVFFNSARAVFAVKENGQVVWVNSLPPMGPPAPPPSGDRVEGSHRPPNYAPAMLTDVYGRAQVLITRQLNPPFTEKDNDYRLRAFRASDGKLLWSSENQSFLKDLSFAGTPAVCGRYTYAVALATHSNAEIAGDRNVDLILIALDTLTGDLRWQTTLGRFKLTVEERGLWGSSTPWDEVWEQSEPLVVGDAVYLTPNAGFAAAIGRFDGKLRWLRTYPKIAMDGPRPPRTRVDLQEEVDERRRYFESVRKGTAAKPSPRSVDPALGERWRGTPVLCGSVLIIAPQDTATIHGIDAATGRSFWSTTEIDVPTLIGQTATTAIFAGSAVTAVEARNGQVGWRWEPKQGSRISGPAVTKNQMILVPTNTAVVALRAEDGSVAKEPSVVPLVRRLLTIETTRKAIDEAGMGKGFGLLP